jgi:hypothetical protein
MDDPLAMLDKLAAAAAAGETTGFVLAVESVRPRESFGGREGKLGLDEQRSVNVALPKYGPYASTKHPLCFMNNAPRISGGRRGRRGDIEETCVSETGLLEPGQSLDFP